MRAQIAYYDPPRRPAPGVRPDFTSLPLTAMPVTIGDMRDGSAGDCSLDREGFAPSRRRPACATSTTATR